MTSPLVSWRALPALERRKAALLGLLFFLTIATLWVLKPIRSASFLTHLGARELPYVRLGTVIAVGLVVIIYSRVVDRLTRIRVAQGASLLFAAVLLLFWTALEVGGELLGAQRWFVWSVFIMVDIYSTVMVGIFWIYANDVVSREEADRLYGPIGVGGTVGGIVGGAAVDSLVSLTGSVHLLLLSAALCIASALVFSAAERILKPLPRVIQRRSGDGIAAATQGWREVAQSRYLLLLVGVVITYEFAAAMTDFVVNVVFERTYTSEVVLAQMFGRLGWIVSATALLSQVVLVPTILPKKHLALLLPPIAMGLATVGLAILPVAAMAILLSAADRGLNYSLEQATKETLYVPLTDAQKYKGKAVIDMFIDRLGKAASAIALIVVLATAGLSISALLGVAFAALVVWVFCAHRLGRAYAVRTAGADRRVSTPPGAPPQPAIL
jgi:AAA family ATP:ADP antiporter